LIFNWPGSLGSGMRSRARNLLGVSAAMALVVLMLAVGVSSASAAFGVSKWEAGVCASNVPECNYASPPSQFFTQAAGHPAVGLTDFSFNTSGAIPPLTIGTPDGAVKDVRVDLPEGLNVDPQATPQCLQSTFEATPTACAASQVGISEVTSEVGGVKVGPLPFPVYNLVPPNEHPALFGFTVGLPGIPIANVFLVADVEWAGDYHEGFTISNVPNSLPLVRNRLVFEGTKGGTFLTNPSPCNGPTSTGLKVDSYESPGSFLSYLTTPPAKVIGCAAVPFKPTVTASVNGAPADSPATVSASLNVPQKLQPINSSTVNKASVTLPRGVGLNPATAPGLEFCPNKSFPLKSKVAVTCPPKSQIGTVAIETPVLPAGSLKGPVYLAPQESRVPTSGKEFRIFFNAISERYGVQVRLEGKVAADPATGQLTATFEGAPQVAFSSVTLNFSGTPAHPIPALSSPPTCTSSAVSQITPWSTLQPVATPATTLTLTSAPNKQPCAKTLAERPFAPGVSAHPGTSQVLTYTPYELQITRPEGQQEIKGLSLTLPPGATAKLAGVPYCPQAAINAAGAKAGKEEQAKPSCPSESKIGVATVLAGTGASPLKIEGKAYLAGPYKGAPLSIAVVTPAVAGPFDLGVVVVRAPLNLNPETAQIEPSAEIPDVFGGTKLDIRSIAVNVNRKEFTLNGTNCKKSAVTGAILGGGADPTNPSAWSSVPFSEFARGVGCKALKFKPSLHLKLSGATVRNKHPKLRAALVTKEGQANVASASVALPHAIFLDQSSLATVCTRVQFAAQQCPKKSIYGHARAFSPLLDKPLEGPVYLRSSNNTLPDMVAHLVGQVTIDLDGRIDSFKGGIRTTFGSVPDVPVSKFVLTLPGGKHGLLINSTNLCKKPVKAIIRLKAQNSRKANRHSRIQTSCGGKHKKKGKHKKGAHKKHAKGHGGNKKGQKGKSHKHAG
jgi:hypothetical protein